MIPVCSPWLTDEDRAAVAEALARGCLAGGGDYIPRFEHEWASRCGRRFGVAVSNGTAALELAVHAMSLPPGSEVILPDFTIISCARAVVANGLQPVLVDADPLTWTMDIQRVEEAITSRTSAIMPVHIYGHPVDMPPLMALAKQHGLAIIEDAAEAHGATCHARRCGSFGEISIFSFYANKIVTTGEGGMVVFDDEAYLPRCRQYRELGFSPTRRFLSEGPGGNFRFTAMQAALGLSQMKRLDEAVAKKRFIADTYRRHFAEIDQLILPIELPWATNVYWMFGVLLSDDYPGDAATLIEAMRENGVETRPFFLGMHEQPVLKPHLRQDATAFPISRTLARRGFYLPSGLDLTAEQLESVAATLIRLIRK